MNHRQLTIEHYTAKRIPNPNPDGETPWQVYHTVRNALVRCCRRHGPTGPMGVLAINSKKRALFDRWESGDPDPWYYIIDDQYNSERYLYAELCRSNALSLKWLESVTRTLSKFPGWGLGIVNIPNAYLLVFERKLMVHGKPFGVCKTASDVVKVGRAQLALHKDVIG